MCKISKQKQSIWINQAEKKWLTALEVCQYQSGFSLINIDMSFEVNSEHDPVALTKC